MGNIGSVDANSRSDAFDDDPFWNPQSATRDMNQAEREEMVDNERGEHRVELQRNLEEFKQELKRKHEKRRQLIAEKRREFQQVKGELEALKGENEQLKSRATLENSVGNSNADLSGRIKDLLEENDYLRLQMEKLKIQVNDGEEVNAKNRELRITVSEMQLDVQKLNSELLNIEQERLEYSKHIEALKDVVKVTKNMLEIRESQIKGLNEKVKSVEELLASKEMKIMSDGLRDEYEKQLRNIRNLRTLYEERQRLDKIDKEHLQVQLEETKKQLENEQSISSDRLSRIEELESDNSAKYDQITGLQSSLGLTKAECTELQAEIDVINQLFSQILLGFNNSPEIDFDKLRGILEENHDLLTDIASNEESHSTAAALPKVLLDLINQINNETQPDKTAIDEQSVANALHQLNSPAAIVENLPKVWKVLIELLSHQNPPLSALREGEKDPCYKSVETPTGPKLKLSVSQTFIRLKDLIIEKKFLEREMYRLKHLNTHLEGRLQDQEKRLELVSGELTTTWHVVEKMQKQHRQLHTHEKVLRYELHEKRKLLTELKEELQYCREKWVQAREKNDSTQEQWKELRKEFAARKTRVDDFNQSGESGYSDDKDSSEEDEKGYESDVSDGKKESDCDDLDNAPLAAIQATCRRRSCEQVDEQGKDNEMEIGAPQNADSQRVGDKALTPPNMVDETNVSIDDCEENLPEVSNSDNPTLSSTGAIRKLHKENKTSTKEKTTEERLDIQLSHEYVEQSNIPSEIANCSVPSNKNDVGENSNAIRENQPSCSEVKVSRTAEEIFAAREERLKRLEKESNELFKQVTKTKIRSTNISEKLDSLHEIYGENSAYNEVNTAESTTNNETGDMEINTTNATDAHNGNKSSETQEK